MKVNEKELKTILENHRKWLDNEGGECANLKDKDLSGLNLIGIDLSYANLSGANLSGVRLINTTLTCANLTGANLNRVDLSGANLTGAKLSGAHNLENIFFFNENTSMFALNCPEKGGFTAFKKLSNNVIAELYIPARAKRSSATSRKCRASEAKVVKMWNYKTKETVTEEKSHFDETFVYKTGETVKTKEPFDDNRWEECASGIHFFMTQKEAENY